MIVKNWMSKNPDTISSDLTAKQALFAFEEKRVPFLSVVDDGNFKGFLARRDLREAASWAVSTQDIHEIEYFNSALKVKDIMVRRPVTLTVDDTIETALKKSKQFGRSFLPVMDGEKLAGTLSNRDMTGALDQILSSDKGLHGISIELGNNPDATIKTILNDIFKMGLEIQGLFTLKTPDNGGKRLIIRFEAKCLKRITDLLEDKGYSLLEIMKKPSEPL